VAVVGQYVPSVRDILSPLYFRNFCDKFAAGFLTTFYELVVGQKRISEMGTQQLRVDVDALKSLMLRLPLLGMAPEPPASSVPRSFSKYVLVCCCCCYELTRAHPALRTHPHSLRLSGTW
jgi:hypothetical protein